MVFEMRMPKLGLSMEEGTVVQWLAQEGDWAEKGEALLVVETEKVQNEIEALASGYLHIVADENEVIPVSGLLGLLAETLEELDEIAAEEASGRTISESAAATSVSSEMTIGGEEDGFVKASPAARKRAVELGIDLRKVEGTGPGGRVVLENVENSYSVRKGDGGSETIPSEAEGEEEVTPKGAAGQGEKRVKRVLPMAGMRRTIARRMVQSLHTAAQMTSLNQIDVTQLEGMRVHLQERAEELGVKVNYTGLMVKAAAVALKEQPIMNSSVVGDEIVMWDDVNIGVAVTLSGKKGRASSSPPASHENFELNPPQSADREHGLVVPVVCGADGLSIVEICRRIEELAEKARRKTLTIEEVSNSTFTVTNIGWYGDEYGTPIINPPEVAVIGIGVIGQKPVVIDGEVVARTIMPVSLTVDHRAIDGATGGDFFKRVRELLENPGLLLADS